MISIWISILAITALIYYYFTRTFNVWRDQNISGPIPIPFFGNLKENFFRRKHIGVIYKEIYDKFPDAGMIGIYRLTNPTLIIRDLDMVKQILVKDFDYFSDRGIEYSKEGLGDNLFHCDKEVWQALHRHLTPLFTSGKLKNNFPFINQCADNLVNYMQRMTTVEPDLEVHQCFRKYIMSVVMGALFGINIDLYNESHENVEKAAKLIFRSTYGNEIDMLYPNILKKVNMSMYPKSVNKICYDVVQIVNQKKSPCTQKNDLFDVLFTLKEKGEVNQSLDDNNAGLQLTEHVMASQVFIFLAAGYGNTTLAMSYALFRLAEHQDIQDKLINEIDDVLKKYDGKLTHAALKEMTYLDKVLSEVLRLNVFTHAILRGTKEDYKVKGTGSVIPKGTMIVISPYAIHRDEKLYPNPDKFDPERFSAENSANRHPYAYIPFGAGPRACIARLLAKMQFCVGIVNILTKFRVSPSEKTKIIENYDPMNTLLATKGGVYVKFTPRKH